ncbi:TnsA endonuclease N-terminal domain-containing protein [Vibrio parahaemolyticus]|uniref:TnsA endonuclease N-terminal domain-containing protein n=1 Tax=Vibrio alginolyticus TaxID=663 RepID=UPI0009968F2B|nr:MULTISPECIES: TnsA endonuclease N-terminal domain-containing protein [Vibrio harveyi group]EGR1973004.1 heteromeric transposase endonuclease subunit TnsA [Vibrio parahaemolyticus]EJO2022916.1 Tn7 transposase TnsA N-terminal domain-containing protein [Vibrio parahaemolyticus]ELZ7233658.1 Tn7 transposase TnsA N-terminal domain-containing protein [Vibrio parahaemolyticus]MDF4278113.1 TnsA endonuclease N-terminal domain-containing protein [Vibrio parahaemolyticus]MDF5050448.1 TnsA endonuclease 
MGRGRKLETFEDYSRALKGKYGLGEGKDYKPWLRVQDVKSRGIRSQIYGRKTQRVHHLLSSIESQLFYLSEFSDSVIDIREQFPLLPLNYTQKIAKVIGVEHPAHPISGEPIVITTDVLLTISTENGIRYQAISVKPEDEVHHQRVLEKIDIERVCWELLNVPFSFFVGNELTRTQSKNIDWATAPFREDSTFFSDEQVTVALQTLGIGQRFVEDVCDLFTASGITSHDESLTLLRYLIANKLIDVDLSCDIAEEGIIRIDGVHLIQRGIINGDR